jgi:hypothetical protein
MKNLSPEEWNSIQSRLSTELGVHESISGEIVAFLQKQPEFVSSAKTYNDTEFKDMRNAERQITDIDLQPRNF